MHKATKIDPAVSDWFGFKKFRKFYLVNNHGGCSKDAGWIAYTEASTGTRIFLMDT